MKILEPITNYYIEMTEEGANAAIHEINDCLKAYGHLTCGHYKRIIHAYLMEGTLGHLPESRDDEVKGFITQQHWKVNLFSLSKGIDSITGEKILIIDPPKPESLFDVGSIFYGLKI